MEAFYLIVITIAIILLIVILTYIGVKMTNKSSNVSVYPPTTQKCPDYWVQSDDATNNICVVPPTPGSNTGTFTNADTYGLGTLSNGSKTINFSDAGWSNASGTTTCNQKKWANKHNIQWDGVSNYNAC